MFELEIRVFILKGEFVKAMFYSNTKSDHITETFAFSDTITKISDI